MIGLDSMRSDKTLQPVTAGLAKWREGARGPFEEVIFEGVPLSDLPKGTYDFYCAVAPAGRTDSYYVWQTFFEVR